MIWPIITVAITEETDIVLTRQRARQLAALMGFDMPEQTRLTTAVSEIARNAFEHGGPAAPRRIRAIANDGAAMLEVSIADRGRGIANLDAVLLGQHESQNGMGIGLRGARRLMDAFSIESAPAKAPRW
ncbi:MAG: ATP-binding protein [Pseudomonadota bacterium]